MDTIQRVWQDFDQANGYIELKGFQSIMVKIAQDQGLFEGD